MLVIVARREKRVFMEVGGWGWSKGIGKGGGGSSGFRMMEDEL